MRSLKITLLLAVFCIAFMGVTYTNDAKKTDVEDVQTFDLDDPKYQIATDKGNKDKPPTV